MKFLELASYLQKLEDTSKRLEITSILAELITKFSVNETDKGIYLCLGYLKPQFETEKFNMAEKMVIKAMEKAYPQAKNVLGQYKQAGDLGDVAYQLHQQIPDQDLSLSDIHQRLLEIARLEGTGSQESKIGRLAQLLLKVDKLSAKFIVRIVLGSTRLGFTELTIIDALSKMLAGDKSLKSKIESKYFVHPDIGLISKLLKKDGREGLAEVKMETGVPILAQKAQRAGGLQEIADRLKQFWAEYKFDGTRVQLHLDKDKKFQMNIQQADLFGEVEAKDYLIKTFTRNLEDSTHQHPEIARAAMTQVSARSIVLDGEAIGIDRKTGEFLPFQQIMQRKRKHAIKEMSAEIPLQYFVFDILFLDGQPLIDKPLRERHEILKRVVRDNDVIKVAEHIQAEDVKSLTAYFEKAKKLNLEGLIVKKPDDPYQAGARSFSWVKLKKADEKLLEDSVDLVVLGYYRGKGERSKFGIGGFLAGILDDDKNRFLTISKVGTGLKDEDWEYLKKIADKHILKQVPSNVDMTKIYTPDVILEPKIVVEIGADEISVSKTHTAGYALRFPRLLYFRTDKNPTQATTLNEITRLYSLQKRGSYKKLPKQGGEN